MRGIVIVRYRCLTSSHASGMAQQRKIRALGISGARRWKQMPGVPTIAEAGIKDFEFYAWFGFWFPPATPAELVNRVQAEITKRGHRTRRDGAV